MVSGAGPWASDRLNVKLSMIVQNSMSGFIVNLVFSF
jgi:hypothetical protein